jgi:3-isopropylmalate dehydrogenase
MGAVGGPQWAGQPYDSRPEAGLLALRGAMQVFANLRPARCFAALAEASSLKHELVDGLDILFVRELVGGIYFGEPRGIETLPNGERRGFNTQSYTTGEIRRVARTAFELARGRSGRVCSVEKANVMESGLLWREEVSRLRDEAYPDIDLGHMYADNCAMQLVKAPKQFDIILTDNLFGDLLSDLAAMSTGSLGMLPSAALGEPGRPGLYEPIHGSAPDIAGKGIANPSAQILSFAMLLRWSFGMEEDAKLIETAVEKVLGGGLRTADIMQAGMARVGTTVMGEAVVRELEKLA